MNYISETVKTYTDVEPEIGEIAMLSICSQCPAGVWQISNDGKSSGSLFCLCTKLNIQSYTLSKPLLTHCDYQGTALMEYKKMHIERS